MVVLHAVDGQCDHLHVPLAELTGEFGGSAKLCGTDRGVITGVGEQDPPTREREMGGER